MKPLRPVRPHPTDPTAALVELTRGYWAVIDAADAEVIGRFNWCAIGPSASGTIYAGRTWRSEGGKMNHCLLHRVVAESAGMKDVPELDHRNRNGLDCRRSNLRAATTTQNHHNVSLTRRNRSGIKNVSWNAKRSKWLVQISLGGNKKYRAAFATKDEAAVDARRMRESLHGEFANHGEA